MKAILTATFSVWICMASTPREQALEFVAKGEYGAAGEILERQVASGNASVRELNDLGLVRRLQGRLDEAERLYEAALARAGGREHPDYATLVNNIGQIAYSRRDFERARQCYEEALAIWLQRLGPDDPAIASAYANIGALLMEQKRYRESERYLRQALELDLRINGPAHQSIANDYSNLAALAFSRGRLGQAERLLLQALDMRERTVGVNHPDYAATLVNLGAVYVRQNRMGEAQTALDQALPVLERAWGAGSVRLVPLRHARSQVRAKNSVSVQSLFRRE